MSQRVKQWVDRQTYVLIVSCLEIKSQDGSVGTPTGYRLDDRCSGVRIFLFSTAFRPALGPTKLLFSGYRVHFLGGKAAGE
jgi:hypothetical protein